MLVDDSFVISQPSRSYAVKPVVQLTSVLNPRLVSSSSGSNLSLTKNSVGWGPVPQRLIMIRLGAFAISLILVILALAAVDGENCK